VKINLGAQKGKKLRTPHSNITAPKTSMMLSLLHCSTKVKSFHWQPACAAENFLNVSLICEKQNSFRTKAVI
ncbi:MAG: hypothetical protein JXA81_06665, partial [Sedimentisphaerales bacterium]|nr:hypothetical protein [Sedimentisphaerales bacterium]